MTDMQSGSVEKDEKDVIAELLAKIETASDYKKFKKAVSDYLTYYLENKMEALESEKNKSESGMASSVSDSQKDNGFSKNDVDQILKNMDEKWERVEDLTRVEDNTIDLSKLKDSAVKELIGRKMNEIKKKKPLIRIIEEFISTEKTFRDSLQYFINTHEGYIKQAKLKLTDSDMEALASFVGVAKGIISVQSVILNENLDFYSTENIKQLPNYFKIMTAFFTRVSEDLSMGKYNNLRFNLQDANKVTKTSGDFFILPVQRMPRWGLLVNTLLEPKIGLNEIDRAHFTKLKEEIEKMGKNMNSILDSAGDFDSYLGAKDKVQYVVGKINEDKFDKVKGFLDLAFVTKLSPTVNLTASPADEEETVKKTAKMLSDYISSGFMIKVAKSQSSADNRSGQNVKSNYESHNVLIDLLPKFHGIDNTKLINRIAEAVYNLNKENPEIKFQFKPTLAFHLALVKQFKESKDEKILFLLRLPYIFPESDVQKSTEKKPQLEDNITSSQTETSKEAQKPLAPGYTLLAGVIAETAENLKPTPTEAQQPATEASSEQANLNQDIQESDEQQEPVFTVTKHQAEDLSKVVVSQLRSLKDVETVGSFTSHDTETPVVDKSVLGEQPQFKSEPNKVNQKPDTSALESTGPQPIPAPEAEQAGDESHLKLVNSEEAVVDNLENQVDKPIQEIVAEANNVSTKFSYSGTGINPPKHLSTKKSLQERKNIKNKEFEQITELLAEVYQYQAGIENKKRSSFLYRFNLGKLRAREPQARALINALTALSVDQDTPETRLALARVLKTVKSQIEAWRLPPSIKGESTLQGLVNKITKDLGLEEAVNKATPKKGLK